MVLPTLRFLRRDRSRPRPAALRPDARRPARDASCARAARRPGRVPAGTASSTSEAPRLCDAVIPHPYAVCAGPFRRVSVRTGAHGRRAAPCNLGQPDEQPCPKVAGLRKLTTVYEKSMNRAWPRLAQRSASRPGRGETSGRPRVMSGRHGRRIRPGHWRSGLRARLSGLTCPALLAVWARPRGPIAIRPLARSAMPGPSPPTVCGPSGAGRTVAMLLARLGSPEATDEQLRHAAGLAGLDGVVAELPDGWDTRVGESALRWPAATYLRGSRDPEGRTDPRTRRGHCRAGSGERERRGRDRAPPWPGGKRCW